MTLTLCGLAGSPFFRKICTQLNEKGLDYKVENLSPFGAGDDFTAINPVRRIPVLKDSDVSDDFVLPDSSAIFHYIERKYSEPSLLPSDTTEFGRAMWFEEYADSEMASKIGLGVFRKVIFPQMAGGKPDLDGALETVREKLPTIHDYLESQLDGREWLAGDTFGLADISVAVQYGNLSYAGYAPSAERWPNLAAFMQRVGAKESFASIHVRGASYFAEMQKLEVAPSEGL